MILGDEMEFYDDLDQGYDDDYDIDGVGFADPGGNSALRAATESNPRNLPCPTCHWPNRLTPLDVSRGYQCDSCANALERGMDIDYYDGDDDDDIVDLIEEDRRRDWEF